MDPASRRLTNICVEQKRLIEALKKQVSGLAEQLVEKNYELQRIASTKIVSEDSSSILLGEPNQVLE